jgi:AraC family transcriptional regulator of adaptative response/methylated-DNA-[protein]-cysteine methyltransferase
MDSATDLRWAKILSRDPAADGLFVYSVRTTGIYCRPSCAARRPNPENVRFHDTVADAEAAGFRPCLRCAPGRPSRARQQADLIADACRAIETAETPPALAVLAKGAGLSPHHFHRVFKAITGLTPRDYAASHRAVRIRRGLIDAARVTDAIYDAGFGAPSRFYDRADAILGMTPTQYRHGGKSAAIRFAIGECSLGSILVAASDIGICAISFGDDPDALLHDLQDRFPKAALIGADPGFEAIIATVVGFVEAPRLGLDLPLDIRGTAFQQRVWRALAALPPGATARYADIARAIGAPAAVRAVANACGANALAVAIPCHRVVRTDGALSGYRWGIDRKGALLRREAAQALSDNE